MTIKECYEKMNANYTEAMERFQMEKLIERFMLKFPNDSTYAMLKESVANSDIENSFRAAHTLKGVAANLSFEGLRIAAHELTEQLRSLENEADSELVKKVDSSYKLVVDTIALYEAEKQA